MSAVETSQHAHYVSVIDGSRSGMLLGPFATRREAESRVEQVRDWVVERDRKAWFYGFGTSRVTVPVGATHEPGRLNEQMEVAA